MSTTIRSGSARAKARPSTGADKSKVNLAPPSYSTSRAATATGAAGGSPAVAAKAAPARRKDALARRAKDAKRAKISGRMGDRDFRIGPCALAARPRLP
jgi:hypothetical protein